jgi:hypothetical protein
VCLRVSGEASVVAVLQAINMLAHMAARNEMSTVGESTRDGTSAERNFFIVVSSLAVRRGIQRRYAGLTVENGETRSQPVPRRVEMAAA